MKALILAAGKSTRISSAVPSTPKPLIEIDGQPALVHNLELLKRYGINDCWINLHFEPGQIQKVIGDGSWWNVSVRYSLENEILGTAGAVKNLEKELGDDTFWVIYGDNYTDCDLEEMLRFHKEKHALGTVAVFDFEKNQNSLIAGGKIECDSDGQIQKFLEGEKASASPSNLVNGGIYAFEPEILQYIPQGFSDFGKDVFPALLQSQKKIYAYQMRGFCFAIDTPQAMKVTREILAQRKK